MGYNTTVVILNDALGDIAKDKEFGKKLAAACNRIGMEKDKYLTFPSGSHCNPIHVVESHHADETTLVAIGGNCGKLVGRSWGYRKEEPEEMLQHLRNILDGMGYRIVKKTDKKG